MSADMRSHVDNLTRTARTAGWTMTVDKSMVLKLLAAAELAEADVKVADAVSSVELNEALTQERAALAAYRTARFAR